MGVFGSPVGGEGRGKREERREKREEGRGKRKERRGKREEGRGMGRRYGFEKDVFVPFEWCRLPPLDYIRNISKLNGRDD